ncbi:unnamed protein product [Oreochromis niloticus]|nr:unnamed protein product [Mustela putorius furo]
MAKSETCLVNLRYQDGSEGSPSNPAKFKNQDFAQIKADCLGKGGLFVDNAFPPNSRSLGDLPDLSPSQESEVKWLRPAFWRFGKWVDVVIDDYLPTINKRLLSVSSKDGNEFWAPLLEKAYAKVCGSYVDMHGGSSSEACKDFTGGVNQIYHLTDDNAPSHDELWLTLSRATECKSLICCGTLHKKDFLANIGLVDGHAYSITEITEVELNSSKVRLVRIMNPWGKREWSGKWSDKMELEDFFRYFSAVFICCETPNFLDGDFKCQWKCMIYDGRVEEGAANHSTFATNPQYRIQVSVIDKLEPEDKNILLSLMEKPQQDSRNEIKLNPIGLTIYKVRPGTPQGRLGSDFFNRTSPVKAPTMYTGFREVVELLSLEPGEYVIIPFTNKPNVTADFVLTIYTKADVKIRSYDGGDENEDDDHLSEIRDKDKERVTDDDPNHALFKLYADQNDELIPGQLQKLLNDRFPHGSGHRGFSLDTCRSMIALVDLDKRMTMTFAEFSILWKKIQEYKNLFHRCDVNENGSLSSPELQKAMEAAGMDVNDGIVGLMMFRYSGFSSTSLEEFITLMLRLDKMSDIFKGKSSDGVIHLNWDEWSVISMYN